MSKRVFVYLIVFLVLMIVFAVVTALALDVRRGEIVNVASGEVLEHDLYAAGTEIVIDGTINGDLYAAGNSVIVNGPVNGDLIACGGSVTVNGMVRDSVMAAGNTVDIDGSVGHDIRVAGRILGINGNVDGDAMLAGGTVDISRTARITGDLIFAASGTRIEGSVGRDVKGVGSGVTIVNELKGNVDLRVGRLIVLRTASIQGDLTYTSEDEAEIESGVQIAGDITHKLPEVKKRFSPFAFLFGIGANVIGFLMALLTGTVIILLAPKWLKSIANSIRTKPGPSAGWGAVILFATPVAAVLACVTVIGIPLGLIALAFYGIAVYLSQIPVGLFIGRWIIGRFREVESKAIMVGALALGLVIFRLARLLPFLGFLVILAVTLFGLGAMVVSEKRRRAEVSQ